MRTQLITYDTAVLAKKKGAPQKSHFGFTENCKEEPIKALSAPVRWIGLGEFACFDQVALQRWLREEKKILIEVRPVDDWNEWFFLVHGEDAMAPFFKMYDSVEHDETFKTYEQAMEAGLKFGLEQLP